MGFLDFLSPAPKLPLTIKVRLKSRRYDRLTSPWKEVTINGPGEWQVMKPKMYEDFRTQYEKYTTKSGVQAQRWNDRVWEQVRKDLVIENEDKIKRAIGNA